MEGKYYRVGWVRPKCGAVMSPYCDVCKNCVGKIENTIINKLNDTPNDINKFQTIIS